MDFTRCYSCMQELDRSDSRCSHCGCDNITVAKAQPSYALPCGYLLHGKYVIGKTLGQGGFGVTYIGWDLALETRVCIKEYFPAGAAMRSRTMSTTVTWSGGNNAEELKGGRDSFIKEARKAVKLRKLNAVVQVWDVFYENETAYLVMDYVEGVTLKHHLLETRKALSEEECVHLLMPVMKDLEEVHARGIIHRDISPDNLMLQPDGTLMLLDIGAAKDLSTGSGLSTIPVAKHGFSPLEQYATGGSIGPWTDVYAMCATIVYCVTGTLIPTPMDRISGEELDLRGISSSFAEVLKNGLAINPEDRIQNVGELQKQLQAALQGKGESTQNETEHQDNDALETERLEKDYQHAIALMAWNDTSCLLSAQNTFSALGQYRDSEAMAERCKELIKSMTEQDNQTDKHNTHSEDASNNNSGSGKKTVLTTIRKHKWTAAATGFVVLALVLSAKIVPLERSYRKADALMSGEYYAQAFNEFSALGNYRDSSERAQEALDAINEVKYVRAKRLLREGKNQESAELFKSLGDYKDSQSCAREAEYLYANELFESADYKNAAAAFKALGNYNHAAVRFQEANYQYALALTASEDWKAATIVFNELGDYQDSPEQYDEACYRYGLELLDGKEYKSAVGYFRALGDYKESRNKMREAQYAYACENNNDTDVTTYTYLKELSDSNYKNSKEMYRSLYNWRIELVACNTNRNDDKTIETSVSRYAEYLRFDFKLLGGPPGGKVTLTHRTCWPSGSVVASDWYWENVRAGDTFGLHWEDGLDGVWGGTLRIRVYDQASDELLGEASVKITT